MVCHLTIGKKNYIAVEKEMRTVLEQSEKLRDRFTNLIDKDTQAFYKVMEAYGLPKETDDQKALRSAAIEESTKEAALVPLEVMKHVIDALALARIVAEKGNVNSISDAGVGTLMLNSALESAALNVQINLISIKDTEFVGWRSEEIISLKKTCNQQCSEIMNIVTGKIQKSY